MDNVYTDILKVDQSYIFLFWVSFFVFIIKAKKTPPPPLFYTQALYFISFSNFFPKNKTKTRLLKRNHIFLKDPKTNLESIRLGYNLGLLNYQTKTKLYIIVIIWADTNQRLICLFFSKLFFFFSEFIFLNFK